MYVFVPSEARSVLGEVPPRIVPVMLVVPPKQEIFPLVTELFTIEISGAVVICSSSEVTEELLH